MLLVPPDTRPPTLAFPIAVARATHTPLLTPPAGALNHGNQAGDFTELKDWLGHHTPAADVLIINLEQLTLGGMIPARRVDDTFTQAHEKLALLRSLKQHHPNLTIYAHGVIVRVAHDNDPFEEKPYYGQYGMHLRAYSDAFDRYQRQPSSSHQEALQHAVKPVPEAILRNWLDTRRRNHQLHVSALEYVRDGIIDHLCITLDDTSEYGLAACDRRALEARADALGLWSQVDIYPGADEVPMTLLARAIRRDKPVSKIYLLYSSSTAEHAGLMYEDRPLGALVAAQLRAVKARAVPILSEADTVLAVNAPGIRQAEPQPDVTVVDTPHRHLPAFVDTLAELVANADKPVCLADVAYPNGAEKRLLRLLEPRFSLSQLAGFSAWNTAGNTLGSTLALAVLHKHCQDEPAWLTMLFDRLVDDYLYQTEVRPALAAELRHLNPLDLAEHVPHAEMRLNVLLEPLARDLWNKHFAEHPALTGFTLDWQPAKLAWARLFTGVFNVQFQPK
jgi:hypothetical protein